MALIEGFSEGLVSGYVGKLKTDDPFRVPQHSVPSTSSTVGLYRGVIARVM